MSAGRTLASLAAVAAVAGAIVVAVGMSNSAGDASDAADPGPAAISTVASIPAVPRLTAASAGAPARVDVPAPTTAAAVTRAAAPTTAPSPTRRATATPTRARSSATTHTVAPAATRPVVTRAAARPTTATIRTTAAVKPAKAAKRGIALPLHYATGTATRVITVTATSRGRTVAHLQAWYKAPGGGWLHYGKAVTAHIGAAGMTSSPNEGMSATPMGSFTLTQAFGRLTDPGTSLPYFKTRPSDWWISQSGRLYNTHQRCASHCSFAQGAPNEHLYYETPYYNYAVVIDYNTRNAPGGVHQGAGSAFFLHVYPPGTGPTAGCVSIPQAKLVTLMRWLRPATHPRILIGVP